MKKIWFDEAWEDYLYWQKQDKKILKRINVLLKDIERNHFDGIGKPEPLKGELSGFWSREVIPFAKNGNRYGRKLRDRACDQPDAYRKGIRGIRLRT